MKKLMIAMAVVIGAIATQAASVTWNATGFSSLDDCSLTTTGKKDVKMMVWEFTATTWNSDYEDGSKLWAAYQAGTLKATDSNYHQNDLSKTTKMASAAGGTGWTDGDTVYAAILFLHDDSNKFTGDEDHWMANWSTKTATDAGAVVDSLGTKIGGTGLNATTTATTWNAIPEPTSGLLLLLGMAGLALRRRRA